MVVQDRTKNIAIFERYSNIVINDFNNKEKNHFNGIDLENYVSKVQNNLSKIMARIEPGMTVIDAVFAINSELSLNWLHDELSYTFYNSLENIKTNYERHIKNNDDDFNSAEYEDSMGIDDLSIIYA